LFLQAISYGREALQLRRDLLKKKFKFNLSKFISGENQCSGGQGFVSLEAWGQKGLKLGQIAPGQAAWEILSLPHGMYLDVTLKAYYRYGDCVAWGTSIAIKMIERVGGICATTIAINHAVT
jgi:hypothetical protein